MNELPCDVPTEKLVLGAILLSPCEMDNVRGTLETDDFAVEPHRVIWRRMTDPYDGGGVVDRVTLLRALKDSGDLERAGGISSIVSLDDGLPVIVNLQAYVQILKNIGLRRKILLAAAHLEKRCLRPEEPLEELVDALRGGLADMALPQNGHGPITAHKLIEKYGLDDLLAPRRHKGLRLPWTGLDSILCGLHPDQMVLLAAHTSWGKTSLALQIAAEVLRQRKGVLIFTREMSSRQLFRRMVNQAARIDYEYQRHGLADPETRRREQEAAAWLDDAPLTFDEDSATVPAMIAATRQVKARQDLGLVVVDYLQLVRAVGRVESRAKEVGANSRALKMAAKDFHIPFLVLSQFSRESAKEGRQPEIYDLKESGDVENDSDVVILIRPDDPRSDADVRPVKLFVAKQREGPRNRDVPMLFFARSQRFEEEAQGA